MTQSRRPNAEGKRYKAATAVFAVELGKMLVSLAILVFRQVQISRTKSSNSRGDGSIGSRSSSIDEDATTAIEMSDSAGDATEVDEAEEKARWERTGKRSGLLLSSLPSSVQAALPSIYEQIFNRDGLQMIVPASLYVLQNNLQLRAAEHLCE